MAISVSEALRHEPQPGRTYIPRIIHVDAETIRRKLIGAASHIAWKILAGKYQMIRLRGKFTEHKQLTGELMRKWCWELVEPMIRGGAGGATR